MTSDNISTQKSNHLTKTYTPAVFRIIPITAIILGLVLRCTLRSSSSLWEDEAIAATHALQPILSLIINVLVNDIHPPLYFIELHAWSFFGTSDKWLIINSIFLSYAALASIFIVSWRLKGIDRAYIVTSVFSLLPVSLWMAEEVRMYALLSVMFIWLYYFIYEIFARNNITKRNILAAILLSIAIIYTHAIGFIAVFFMGIYAASYLIRKTSSLKDWLVWLMLFGFCLFTALPMLVASALHKADMSELSSFRDIQIWIASVVVGEGCKNIVWLQILGLFFYFAIVFSGILVRKTRSMTISFLVLPIIFCVVIGYYVRPLFKTNFFSNFYSVFLALVIAELIIAIPLNKKLRNLAFSTICTSLLIMGISNRLALNLSSDYYQRITDLIETNIKTGDVIWVPQTDIFWGVAHYLAGPTWGSPLEINGEFSPQSKWQNVYKILGPHLVNKLHLIPHSQTITTKDGNLLYVSMNSEKNLGSAQRLWLVTYSPRNDLPTRLPGTSIENLDRVQSYVFSPLEVDLYERPKSKNE